MKIRTAKKIMNYYKRFMVASIGFGDGVTIAE